MRVRCACRCKGSYVHEELESAFLDRFAARVAALKSVIPCVRRPRSGRSFFRARPTGFSRGPRRP